MLRNGIFCVVRFIRFIRRNIICRVISDILLLLSSATVAGFVWAHGSQIFNSGNMWETFLSELCMYIIQYIFIFALIVLIGVLLLLRHKHQDEKTVTKEDVTKMLEPIVSTLQQIAEKIGIKDIETNNQSDEDISESIEGQEGKSEDNNPSIRE